MVTVKILGFRRKLSVLNFSPGVPPGVFIVVYPRIASGVSLETVSAIPP